MYKNFSEMPVWQKAQEVSCKVFQLTKALPRAEDYGLTSQIRKSANSVTANIAEAFGRKSKKDKSLFYVFARGSAFETQSHLLYGQKVKYFESNNVNDLIQSYNQLIFDLNKIMKSLSQPQSQPQP